MNEIRFKLEDILLAKLETDVLSILNFMHTEVNLKRVIFWYNNDLNDEKIKLFQKKTKEYLNGISVQYIKSKPTNEFAWFDVVSKDLQYDLKNRFCFAYSKNNKKDLINGLHSFLKVYKFVENSYNKKVYYKKPNGDSNKNG